MKVKRLPRFFKKFFCFLGIFVCFFSLFLMPASANAVSGGSFSLRTVGAPVSLTYHSLLTGNYTSGIINRPNVYYLDTDSNNYTWVEGSSSTDFFSISYNGLSTSQADVVIGFNHLTDIDTVYIDSPILFSSFSDLDQNFNFYLGIKNPSTSEGVLYSSFTVDYSYTFVVGDFSNGLTSLDNIVVSGTKTIYVTGSSIDKYSYVPLFDDSILTDSVIAQYRSFVGSDGFSYCMLTSASFSPGCFTNQIFFEPYHAVANQSLNTYYIPRLDSRFKSIYNAETVQENIIFHELSWTNWLVNAVGGFLDFELVPGLSFSGMLGLLVGMSILIVFLKVFAGG